ncbi:hypothetical protein K2X05_12565 [bacterium]|nr:hypothetical protein [bacterium]
MSAWIISSRQSTLFSWFKADARSVLAALPVRFGEDQFKIVKLKEPNGILIEVYKQIENQSSLYTQFRLEDRSDAYYDFKSSVTNLFVANIDEDLENEIIVPSLTKNLESEINVIKYESSEKKFTLQ